MLSADCEDGSDEPLGCIDSTKKDTSKCNGDDCTNLNTSANCTAPDFFRCGKKSLMNRPFH